MCGVMLSDFGADVVKIESPQGDGNRVIGQFAPNESKGYHVYNRGKRGIVLNLQSAEGRSVIHRLVRDFDVFLINARPRVADRLGIDYETLSAHNERLIYLDNSAFGPEGPLAGRAGADIIAQAYSGLMVGDGKMDAQGNPTLITATTPADFGAAFNGAAAVCAALFHRERTGRGQLIETSLLGAALTMQSFIVSRQPVSDELLVQPSRDAMDDVRARGGTYRELLEARSGLRAITGSAYLSASSGPSAFFSTATVTSRTSASSCESVAWPRHMIAHAPAPRPCAPSSTRGSRSIRMETRGSFARFLRWIRPAPRVSRKTSPFQSNQIGVR
jgi:formyl-CoA transferase